MCEINSNNRRDALAKTGTTYNHAQLRLPDKVRKIKGWGSRAISPAKRSGPRLLSTVVDHLSH